MTALQRLRAHDLREDQSGAQGHEHRLREGQRDDVGERQIGDRQEIADHAGEMADAHQEKAARTIDAQHGASGLREQRQHHGETEQIAEEHDLEGMDVLGRDPDHGVLRRHAKGAEDHQDGGLDHRRQAQEKAPGVAKDVHGQTMAEFHRIA